MDQKTKLEKMLSRLLGKNTEYIKTGKGKIKVLNHKEITSIFHESEEINDAKS